jgi:hypothetical protein
VCLFIEFIGNICPLFDAVMDFQFCLIVPCMRMNAFVAIIAVFLTHCMVLPEALLFVEVNGERIVLPLLT